MAGIDKKGYTLCSQLSWSHNRLILPIKNELKAELEQEIQLIEAQEAGE